MAVTQRVLDNGKKVQINISGRFDYEISQAFRDAYRYLPNVNGVKFCINLSQAVYMDSSALGMLLLLREHAKSNNGEVIIEQPGEQINKILKVANFEQLFSINQGASE